MLSKFDIHSIEQPIKQGQWEAMSKLCKTSPIPIALDEELIGVKTQDIPNLLDAIHPPYIILKPTLIGGFTKSETWIKEAEKRQIKWWATSALESNIGLNDIAQWVSSLNTDMHQGLGTGQIYKNNIPSPLYLEGEHLFHKNDFSWDLSVFSV